MHPDRNGFHPDRNGFPSDRNGYHPERAGYQPESGGYLSERGAYLAADYQQQERADGYGRLEPGRPAEPAGTGEQGLPPPYHGIATSGYGMFCGGGGATFAPDGRRPGSLMVGAGGLPAPDVEQHIAYNGVQVRTNITSGTACSRNSEATNSGMARTTSNQLKCSFFSSELKDELLSFRQIR